mgnify:CR=1 FL=1
MKERIKSAFTRKKILHVLKMALFVVALSLILLSLLGTVVHATGLVDDTVNTENLYSKYPLSNYQLDFYVDNSWSWLPWNWLDGIGKSVQYGLYCITNFVWTISLYLSNATGYVVQEAYKLDFINDMADSIGKSIQTLAGVTENGFSTSGFYVGFLLLIILVVGIYVAYTGLIKRETSKALHAVINFVVVFLLSASFIAYAPDYIKKINDFSSDISTASLDLGTKIMLPDSDSKGKDSVDLIRDSLFSIQVQQPWLLLQFGNSDIEEIGSDRVEALVSASPEDEDGEIRENVVKTEIEDNDNNNLTIPQVVNRLGMVFFLLIFNLGITIFVFLLTGMMLFSQILFIIFAMFLPISFLLSMIPSYESMAKQAIVRVFNTIMTRAGITLIVTVAFSISSMFYNISTDYPFFMVAFLQIVCFAGIYMKLGDLMSMFSLTLATVKAWDGEYSADRICSCDIGLDVWNIGLQELLVLVVSLVRWLVVSLSVQNLHARMEQRTIVEIQAPAWGRKQVQPWELSLIQRIRSRTRQLLSKKISKICRHRPLMRFILPKKRQSPVCPTSSVVWCRNKKTASLDVSRNNSYTDRISLTSVWSFKRHKKQGRQVRKRTDQRQAELPVPMKDQRLLLRSMWKNSRKSNALPQLLRLRIMKSKQMLSRNVRYLLVVHQQRPSIKKP